MKKYSVLGMHCSACVSAVEKAVCKVEGVTACSVSLLTNSMSVEGSASDKDIVLAVAKAGYEAKEFVLAGREKTEKAKMVKRLLCSCILILPLLYLSMGYAMWGFPLPAFLVDSPIAIGFIELALASVIVFLNRAFFVSGTKALLHLSPNMDTLVALGSGISYAWGLFLLLKETINPIHGGDFLHSLTLESSAMILTFITVGKTLEAFAKEKTATALSSLLLLKPNIATIETEGKEVLVSCSELNEGDILLVKSGEKIARDGVIVFGNGSVNQSALTGESLPCEKKENDQVFAGTVLESGFIKVQIVGEEKDTILSKMIETVENTMASKAPISRLADKIASFFVPAVLGIALVTILVWFLVSHDIGKALSYGITVLVISCPCSLGLATPVAITVGAGVGAKNNILFKNASALESAGQINLVVFDKTGTLTKGEFTVENVVTEHLDFSLSLALAMEEKSSHPLAKALVQFATENGARGVEITDFTTLSGLGVSGFYQNKEVLLGSVSLFQEHQIKVNFEQISAFEKEGKTPILLAYDGKLLALFALADREKEGAKDTILLLKKQGITPVLLTGDRQETADFIAKKVGIEKVFAEVLPDKKADIISELKHEGKVMMVGDGINDAPALALADLGVALGTGTDIAMESADVVLSGKNLCSVAFLTKLCKKTLLNIKENLFWAFFYNLIGIPLATGLFAFVGISLPPMFGALAMSLSSFCVVSNALRLFLVKKEEKKMENATLKIEGMMCPHCEARVKKALEQIGGVKEANVSHKKGTAVVVSELALDKEVLKKAVEDAGYTVLEVK